MFNDDIACAKIEAKYLQLNVFLDIKEDGSELALQ